MLFVFFVSIDAETCGFTVNGAGTAEFTARVEQGGQYFLFADCRAASSINIRCRSDSWDVSPGEPYIIDAGELSADTEVSFTVTTDSTASGNLYVARLDTERVERTLARLKEGGLKTEKFTDTELSGTLTAASDGAVLTSLVYDAGWTVEVDGKPVETFAAGQGLLAFDVATGEHTVRMVFFPRGLKTGALLSGISLLLFLALVILRGILDRKRTLSAAEPTDGTETVPAEGDASAVIAEPDEATSEATPAPMPSQAEQTVPEEPASAGAETPADGQTEPKEE